MVLENQRIAELQQAMAEAEVDSLLLRLPENILLASGYWTQLGGMGFAFVPREGGAALILPDYEEPEAAGYWAGEIRTFSLLLDHPPVFVSIERLLRDLADDRGVAGGAVGYEGSFETLSPPSHAGEPNAVGLPTQRLICSSFRSERLVDLTSALETIRAVKSQQELSRIRVVNEIAMFGLQAFKEHARGGRTEAEIAAEVEATIQRQGHGYRDSRVARAYAMVWSGPDTSVGWWAFRSRNRVVEPNDLVMIELATVVDGYWSDHTRTVVAGKPTDLQREAFTAVRGAQQAALNACRPGVSGGDVDAAARAAVAEAGFSQFRHHTGHGVGFRYHESRPQLVPDGKDVLAAGMVVAVEPGIYEPEFGGFRWEDDAVITGSGAIRLAESDFGLE